MVTTIAEILPHIARTHGDRIALFVDDKTFSFRELDAISNRVASGLVAIGINPDSNPQATAEPIRPDGWLHTGDIATMDEDGYPLATRFEMAATIVDRKKDMIITAGFKVFPAEIERVLCMHPAVALAAVGSVPDEAKGELAKAYVILKAGAEVARGRSRLALPRASGRLQGAARAAVCRPGTHYVVGQDYAADAE